MKPILLVWLLTPVLLPGQSAGIDPAFAAARRGKIDAVARLKVTASDIPVLTKYLHDSHETVRREALTLLSGLGRPACAAMVDALVDRSADLRERSARAIHRDCPAEATDELPKFGESLRESIRMGNPAAAPWLLLARSHDPATRRFLELPLHSSPAAVVKLEPWTPPVPQALAAAVAAGAQARLEQGLESLNEAAFLASVLPDIADPGVVRALGKLLDDKRTVAAGVPSGVQPRRRVCDLAVEGFAARLHLELPFARRSGDRYSDAEIAAVKLLLG